MCRGPLLKNSVLLPKSFEIDWVRQYLVNSIDLVGIEHTTVYKIEPVFTGCRHGKLSWSLALQFGLIKAWTMKAWTIMVYYGIQPSECKGRMKIVSCTYKSNHIFLSLMSYGLCTVCYRKSIMVSQAHFKFLQNMLAVTNITGIIAPRENKSNWKYDDVMSWKYGKKCVPRLCG